MRHKAGEVDGRTIVWDAAEEHNTTGTQCGVVDAAGVLSQPKKRGQEEETQERKGRNIGTQTRQDSRGGRREGHVSPP